MTGNDTDKQQDAQETEKDSFLSSTAPDVPVEKTETVRTERPVETADEGDDD